MFRPDFEEALARWPELGNVLEPKDLAPLLTSKNQQIRQNAILLLGRLRERDAVEKTIGPKPGR